MMWAMVMMMLIMRWIADNNADVDDIDNINDNIESDDNLDANDEDDNDDDNKNDHNNSKKQKHGEQTNNPQFTTMTIMHKDNNKQQTILTWQWLQMPAIGQQILDVRESLLLKILACGLVHTVEHALCGVVPIHPQVVHCQKTWRQACAKYTTNTVKSVLSGHPRDQKLVAVKDRWLLSTNCFDRECTAEGQKQNGCITQMAVKGR
jgi:hypothetical protein